MLTKRLGIDLGTCNIRFYLPGKGVVVDEPAVAALSIEDSKIIAIGQEAKEMLGKTPENIIACRPIVNGVIANFTTTSAIISYYLNKILGGFRLLKPEIMITVPAGATSTERRAAIDAVINAGAKDVYVVKEPVAAALGAEIPVTGASGNMIINIGGGITEVAVLSLGGIVTWSSIRFGGNQINEAIINFIRKKYNLIIGEQTAEEIKIKYGHVLPSEDSVPMEISGSNSITGLPESIILLSSELIEPLRQSVNELISAVKNVLQNTPPELAADVIDKGIIMSGGGAKLSGLEDLLTKITGVPCQVALESELCAVKGTGIAIENFDAYKKSIFWVK